jgi:hypothetical protein
MKCQAKTNTGRRCSKNAQDGTEYCAIHAGKVAADSAIVDENEMPENEMPEMDHEVSSVTNQTLNTVHVHEVEEIVQRVSLNASAELQMQVLALKNQVEMMRQKLEQRRQKGAKRPEDVARRAFYHKNRNSPEIIEEIKKRLTSVGMYVPEKPVPWQLVRAATDSLFDALPAEQKSLYLAAAV